MNRTPRDIILAILANLQSAHDACHHRYKTCHNTHVALEANAEARGYRDAMALVRVEAASLLTPPESTEQVRPFDGTKPPL